MIYTYKLSTRQFKCLILDISLAFVTYILYRLKTVKYFVNSEKVLTFALSIGKKGKATLSNNLKSKIMNTMNFKSETDTEKKILALTKKGVKFKVIGRKSIVIL